MHPKDQQLLQTQQSVCYAQTHVCYGQLFGNENWPLRWAVRMNIMFVSLDWKIGPAFANRYSEMEAMSSLVLVILSPNFRSIYVAAIIFFLTEQGLKKCSAMLK